MHLEPSALVCSICSWNGRCGLPSSSTEGTSTVAEVAPEMSVSCWTINSLSAIRALRQTTFSLNRFPLFYSILSNVSSASAVTFPISTVCRLSLTGPCTRTYLSKKWTPILVGSTFTGKYECMIVANLQTTVQNNFGNYFCSNDRVGQNVVEFLGDLHLIHNVYLFKI